MPKLIYVDEQDDQRRAILRAAILSEQFSDNDVISVDPLPELQDMIDEIDAQHPDVLITDYRLNEYKAGVKYSGIDLVVAYQARHQGFPCFVTTGFARDAAGEAAHDVDINSIYSKEETQQTSDETLASSPLPFFVRVRLKLEAYQATIAAYEGEHAALRARLTTEDWSPSDLERLMYLDGELEAMLGGEHRLPDELKRKALQPLSDIVEKAEQLLGDLEEIYGAGDGNLTGNGNGNAET